MTSHQNHCDNLTASKSSSSCSNCRFQINSQHSQPMHVIQQYYQLRKRHTQARRAARVACTGKWETNTELQLAKTTEERQLLGDLRISWKIILKCIFKTYDVTG